MILVLINTAIPHMDRKLLEILVCPVTKGPLVLDKKNRELISKSARLAYPIKDKTFDLLEMDARELTQQEVEALQK